MRDLIPARSAGQRWSCSTGSTSTARGLFFRYPCARSRRNGCCLSNAEAEMTEPAHSQNIASLEAAIPAAPLESILCTDELLKRPRRPPDHERENSALAALVSAVTDSPRTILQTLADKILALLDAD